MSSIPICPKCGDAQLSEQRHFPASSQKSKILTHVTEPSLVDIRENDWQRIFADQRSYFTTVEAANYIRVSKQFLEIARHRGDGPPFIKLSRAVRYYRPSLDRWMLERQRNHTAEEMGYE